MVLSVSLRRVFIYLLRPRWHRKSLRFAASFPMPTTPEQSDFAHGKSFILCIFQPTKSACSAATVNRLSGVEQPLFSVSGRKRYNTLDFAGKVACQQGCCSPLLDDPEPKEFLLWNPLLSVQWLSILFLHDGCGPAQTGKTGTEICPNGEQISVPILFSDGWAKHTRNPRF